MLVTELGRVMEVREEQPENAYSPMLVTELRIMVDWHPAIRVLVAVSIMALQFSRESYTVLPLSTTKEVRLSQPLNALSPMLVTELGRVMEVRERQPSNALYPMLVTELGMVMEVREEQLLNALSPMFVKELGRMMEVREEQPAKAAHPMLVTELGMVMEVRLSIP